MKKCRHSALLAWLALLSMQAANPATAPGPLIGEFGGDRTNASFGADSARLDLDCATAEIRRAVQVAADGRFEAKGLYVSEHVGPIEGEAAARAVEVTLAGRLQDGRLELTISIPGRVDAEQLTLRRGHRVRHARCLSSGEEVRGRPRLASPAAVTARERRG